MSNIRIKNMWLDDEDGNIQIMILRRDLTLYWAVVSAPDFYERIAPLPVTWCVCPAKDTTYAYAKDYSGNLPGQQGGGKTLRLHRVIMGLTEDDPREVDHIDRDGLNNTRENLQIVTRSQNQQRRYITDRPSKANKKTGIRNVRKTASNKFGVDLGGRWYGTHDTADMAARAAEAIRENENNRRLQIVFRNDKPKNPTTEVA